jgi:hypothetical protein
MNSDSVPASNRCQHRTPSGRRCSSSALDPAVPFCARHTVAAPNDCTDLSAELIRESEHFQEAQQINHSLIALYKLVAAGRISPRRASVLAYIAHLILNTHKAIDYDNQTRWRRRIANPAVRPTFLPLAEIVGPGTDPLPDTPEEFAAEVAKRSHTTTS